VKKKYGKSTQVELIRMASPIVLLATFLLLREKLNYGVNVVFVEEKN